MGLIEEPLALAAVLRTEAAEGRCLLVDCLTLWLTNLLMLEDDQRLAEERDALLACLEQLPGTLILVSNETGLGVVPMGRADPALCRPGRLAAPGRGRTLPARGADRSRPAPNAQRSCTMTQAWWRDACHSLDNAAMDQARARQQQLTKPAGSLGQLEGLAVQLAGLQGRERPALDQAASAFSRVTTAWSKKVSRPTRRR